MVTFVHLCICRKPSSNRYELKTILLYYCNDRQPNMMNTTLLAYTFSVFIYLFLNQFYAIVKVILATPEKLGNMIR